MISQTEDIIDKHTKVMDKLEKKKKDVREIIGRGEKLAEMAKAPQFLGEKLAAMKKLWNDANNEAKQRLDDLKNNAGCWNAFAEKCALLQTQVSNCQKQIDDVKKLYDMAKAKEDHSERVSKATAIKADIAKTLDGVLDANNVLQVLADDDTKVQLNQEVDDLKTACEVSKAIDDKLVWLDNFNKSIMDYDKICKELEEIVVKDRKDLDALIKPDGAFKATDRLVFAMDLADDIRGQIEIANSKQELWDQGLSPEGKENTAEAKEFVRRMTEVSTKLASLEKESDGEAAEYGSPNSLEEATKMLDDCKQWRESTASVCTSLETGKANADKMTLHEEQDRLYAEMKARWVEVDKSCKEWSVKLDELSGMWTKQTEMLNKVTSTMVSGEGEKAGEQVNLNELDARMEQIKDMFVKKQEMMKKMSTTTAPNPAELTA